ncbi:hypothetical protein [Noviherbaspirillum malthae]|uniref:hypothetical protein n=1 Tax=Noviherbaspirillum malthae TaxID=1260987 RepID=UPI00188E4B21|nr:hypothetical protein [Noviherbaspirillum malthae]
MQKKDGRSLKVRALRMLMEQWRRKADSAGGELIDLVNRPPSLSQIDQVTICYVNKRLKQRCHTLGHG